ncbi:MAG: hypothetical protein CME71_10280 [Halobacteriovorax sp.]|nr:hypothetical protein [Halobacteriovorax sp.]
MLPFYKFNKPEYVLRPKQLIKRLFNKSRPGQLSTCMLPWGAPIQFNPGEVVGKSIDHLGLYELATSEFMSRLLEYCDEFVDIGANIGYFSLVALRNSKFKGTIHSFEPHPKIFEMLTHNINLQKSSARFKGYNLGLSTSDSQMELYIPQDFALNEGVASLEKPEGKHSKIVVDVKRLDHILGHDKKYILKIDTEGHEFSVLKGASDLFVAGSINAVFFEEFSHPSRAESFKFLQEHGFEIFRIERSFFGPKLKDPLTKQEGRVWEPVNYLAIKNDTIPMKALNAKGWSVLKN